MLTKIKLETPSQETLANNDEGYPYGTSLSFSDELLNALNTDGMQVGSVVEVRAVAFVENVRQSKDAKMGENASMTIQLTEIDVELMEKSDAATVLYGGGES